jgi:hypothetical protein
MTGLNKECKNLLETFQTTDNHNLLRLVANLNYNILNEFLVTEHNAVRKGSKNDESYNTKFNVVRESYNRFHSQTKMQTANNELTKKLNEVEKDFFAPKEIKEEDTNALSP